MGQIISTEDVIWYNANAWRNLSSTYLNRIRAEEENISLASSLDDNVAPFGEYRGAGRGRTQSPLTLSSNNRSLPRHTLHQQQFTINANGGPNERKLYSSKTNLEDANNQDVVYDRIRNKMNKKRDGGSSMSSSDQLDASNLREQIMLKNLSAASYGAPGGTPRVMGRRKQRQLAHAADNTSSAGVQKHYLNKTGQGATSSPSNQRRAASSSFDSTEWSTDEEEDNLENHFYPSKTNQAANGLSVPKISDSAQNQDKRTPPGFQIRSKQPLPPLGYTSSSSSSAVKSNPPNGFRSPTQHQRNNRTYSPIEQRRRRKLGDGGARDDKSSTTNHLNAVKWTLAIMAIVNLGCSIWAGIYMQLAYNWIERGLPIQGLLLL